MKNSVSMLKSGGFSDGGTLNVPDRWHKNPKTFLERQGFHLDSFFGRHLVI